MNEEKDAGIKTNRIPVQGMSEQGGKDANVLSEIKANVGCIRYQKPGVYIDWEKEPSQRKECHF